jgi:hypothetical protein
LSMSPMKNGSSALSERGSSRFSSLSLPLCITRATAHAGRSLPFSVRSRFPWICPALFVPSFLTVLHFGRCLPLFCHSGCHSLCFVPCTLFLDSGLIPRFSALLLVFSRLWLIPIILRLSLAIV